MKRERLKVLYSKASSNSSDPFILKVLKFVWRLILFFVPLLLKRSK